MPKKKNPRPATPDFSRMSDVELLAYTEFTYGNLQRIWRAELALPCPNWAVLEEVARQLSQMERAWEALKET